MKDLDKHSLMPNSDETETHSKTYDLTVDDFHKCYQVVFVDSSGYLNLTSNVSKNVFLRLKHEASISIALLKNEFIDCFDALFISNHSVDIRFDALIK